MKRFCVVWNAYDLSGGEEHDTHDEAICAAEEIMKSWIEAETSTWAVKDDKLCPTEEQIMLWNKMVEECFVFVMKYDEAKGNYDEENVIHPDAIKLGWKMIKSGEE